MVFADCYVHWNMGVSSETVLNLISHYIGRDLQID